MKHRVILYRRFCFRFCQWRHVLIFIAESSVIGRKKRTDVCSYWIDNVLLVRILARDFVGIIGIFLILHNARLTMHVRRHFEVSKQNFPTYVHRELSLSHGEVNLVNNLCCILHRNKIFLLTYIQLM